MSVAEELAHLEAEARKAAAAGSNDRALALVLQGLGISITQLAEAVQMVHENAEALEKRVAELDGKT